MLQRVDAELRAGVAPPRRGPFSRLRAFGRSFAEWVEDCAHHYAAAQLYGHLIRLSDHELAQRGLSRDTLAHDLIQRRKQETRS